MKKRRTTILWKRPIPLDKARFIPTLLNRDKESILEWVPVTAHTYYETDDQVLKGVAISFPQYEWSLTNPDALDPVYNSYYIPMDRILDSVLTTGSKKLQVRVEFDNEGIVELAIPVPANTGDCGPHKTWLSIPIG